MSGTCVLCGKRGEGDTLFTATDRLYRTTSERFRVVRCRHCGLLRLEPRPSPEQLRRYYPENYWFSPDRSVAGRMEETYRRLVLRDHVGFVERAVEAAGVAGPVLDVGCGGGLFLGMIRERGFRVVGLDISPAAAAVAWGRKGVPAVCGTLAAAPLARESFAAVTMFHVLEHLEDPRAYLEAARALLRPGGRLIVQVPDAACWQFRLLGAAWTGVDVPRHLVNFRARDLEALLASQGFEVLRRKHFNLRDNPAGLASSVAPALDPMARRVRRVPESGAMALAKDLCYLALVAAALPLAALEAAFGAGSTIMMEARRP
jgi:2-polyprenyl-3-methyl-5-hydroxy-6-metoxy-1,4-benzoquinol methylase